MNDLTISERAYLAGAALARDGFLRIDDGSVCPDSLVAARKRDEEDPEGFEAGFWDALHEAERAAFRARVAEG